MDLKQSTLLVGFLLAGAAGGYLLSGIGGEDTGNGASGQPEVLYWVAPMDPNFRSESPGLSPMGMELVPVYADEALEEGEEPSLRISPTVENNLGVRTATVERRTMHALVRTVGSVQPNEELTSHLHVRAPGWIEQLLVRSAGDEVAEGDLLFQYYAPELVNAQAEYVQALSSGRSGLVSASAGRLRALGMSEPQIAQVRNSRQVQQLVDIRAPQDGVLIDLNVGEGMYVQPGTTLLSLADLSSVWVLVDVFEDDVPGMMTGLRATMRLPFVPGRVWEGHVDYVYPTVDPVSRTVQVRLAFRDVEGALLPNMYGDIEVHGEAREDVLAIPSEALIRSSEGDRVILALGEGRFRPARVVAGIEVNGFVEILSGLSENETVVTSGQFLIDSEASLDASLMRLTAIEAPMDSMAMTVSSHEDMTEEMDMSSAEDVPAPIIAVGRIVNVMADHNMIRLSHDPIPELGWPQMTMNFDYVGETPLPDFAEGTAVTFTLGYEQSGQSPESAVPVITMIEALAVHDHGHGDHQ